MICPHCRQDLMPKPVGFTWWGGLVGARLINHVECPACRKRYNGRTGRDNTTYIAIYIAVVSALILFVMYYMLTQT